MAYKLNVTNFVSFHLDKWNDSCGTSVNRYVVSWILRRIQQSKGRGNEGLRVGSTDPEVG